MRRPSPPQFGLRGLLLALLGCMSSMAIGLPAHLLEPPPVRTSFTETRVPVSSLPFSFEDAVGYFSRTLGSAPRQRKSSQRQSDFALFETATSADTTLQVAVRRQGPQVMLRFRIEDERGMDVVRNFCKAPFFLAKERELLYELASAGPGIHCAFMPRFDILTEYDMRPEWTVVSFFFSPPVRVCAPNAARS